MFFLSFLIWSLTIYRFSSRNVDGDVTVHDNFMMSKKNENNLERKEKKRKE